MGIGVVEMFTSAAYMLTSLDNMHSVNIDVVEMFTSVVYMLYHQITFT